jgi:putative selenate reductase
MQVDRRTRIEPAPLDSRDELLVAVESRRCLECDLVCDRCVEVCPNRANVAVELTGLADRTQVVHLEELCNDCGVCASFCLWDGDPARDKLTLFATPESFAASRGPGFVVDPTGRLAALRVRDRIVRPGDPDAELDPELRAAAAVAAEVCSHLPYLTRRRRG